MSKSFYLTLLLLVLMLLNIGCEDQSYNRYNKPETQKVNVTASVITQPDVFLNDNDIWFHYPTGVYFMNYPKNSRNYLFAYNEIYYYYYNELWYKRLLTDTLWSQTSIVLLPYQLKNVVQYPPDIKYINSITHKEFLRVFCINDKNKSLKSNNIDCVEPIKEDAKPSPAVTKPDMKTKPMIKK